MFDNIQMIIVTMSDPQALRHHQTHLHIQNLWDQMLCRSYQTVHDTTPNRTIISNIPETKPNSGDLSLDDMLNFMDDFQVS
jgi:hypothetical protein